LIFRDNILLLQFADIVPDVIPIGTYKKAQFRKSIDVIGRGGNGREVLIKYETLPSKWKEKIIDKYDCPYKYAAAQIIKPNLTCSDFDAATIAEFTTSKNEFLPLEVQSQYQTACAYLALMARTKSASHIKKLGFPNKGKFTESIQYLIKCDNIPLPANYSNLKKKLREYTDQGARAVISAKWGNSNSEKITEEMEAWMINEMCRTRLSPEIIHQRYIKIADQMGFRKDITSEAFKNRLTQPHIAQLIDVKRHGIKKVRSKYGQTLKIAPAVNSDDLWIGDGTAIDLAFRDESGKLGIATVYAVIDGMSESMLGWSAREGRNKENYEMQMEAYRMSVRNTGSKPYQLLYDNQGGHKKAEARRFYDQLAQVHFPSRAYRSSAKSIEGVFGRFQRTVLAEYPFWTGFGRQTHSKINNGVDMDKLQRNIQNLPTYEELLQLWQVIVNDWNDGKHHRFSLTRSQVYQQYKDAQAAQVNFEDMMNMFFLVSSEPIKYQANGLTMTRGGKATTYIVYDEQGNIDYNFRERYLKAKFHVKYDPDQEYPDVMLLEPLQNGDMRPVASASPAREVSRVVKHLQPGDRKWIDTQLEAETKYFNHLEERAEAIGYNETEAFTDWRSKIGLKKPQKQHVEAMSQREQTSDDWLDRM